MCLTCKDCENTSTYVDENDNKKSICRLTVLVETWGGLHHMRYYQVLLEVTVLTQGHSHPRSRSSHTCKSPTRPAMYSSSSC
ncbi:hypothetical protein E2C01_082275 [Portunus trituberculatus]|uniref:Uncharacterized protein n=1 Tax=Portunus trituberculatus TaxID=210409 RepID=A0A5B7J4G6_PORTR|nr:hypothetical protein [Portunus trituberculatus]